MINKNKWHSVQNEHAKVAPDTVKHFVACFAEVVKHHGTIREALKVAGVGQSSYYRMINDGQLSVCVGHRIMDAFAEIAPYNLSKNNAETV